MNKHIIKNKSKMKNVLKTMLLLLAFMPVAILRGQNNRIDFPLSKKYVSYVGNDDYLLTLPQNGITVGDSIIKIKNEPFFRIVKVSELEVGKAHHGTIHPV